MDSKKFYNFFLIYILFLFIAAAIHLFFKHTGGADSTISEWLINYQGGFTKRGIIGEVCFILAKSLEFSGSFPYKQVISDLSFSINCNFKSLCIKR